MAKDTDITKSEQSTLSKAVKNVKQKLLTKPPKAEIKISTDPPTAKTEEVTPHRGIVYLGHIPHGFFEEEMRDYFKQFGKVTRVRIVRSKKTGRSRGYGYVEFLNPEVAKIAAESMNNYLMSGRLLKATYIPPEKQHSGYFIGCQWSKQSYPRLARRAKQNTRKNKNVNPKQAAVLVERGLGKIARLEKKLAEAGVIYKIRPVEVPEKVIKKRKATSALQTTEVKKKKISTEIEKKEVSDPEIDTETISTEVKQKKPSTEIKKKKASTEIENGQILKVIKKKKIATKVENDKISKVIEKKKILTEVGNKNPSQVIKKKKTPTEIVDEKISTVMKKKKTPTEIVDEKMSTVIKKKKVPSEIGKKKISTVIEKKKVPTVIRNKKIPTEIKKRKISNEVSVTKRKGRKV